MAQISVTASSVLPSILAVQTVHEDTHLIAPCTIALEAMVTDFGVTDGGDFNPAVHEVEYVWTVRKYVSSVEDTSYQTASYSAPQNVPDALNRKARHYNKRMSHSVMVEDVDPGSPATFEFICTATNIATGQTATSVAFTREVQHPDDGFTDAETFVQRSDSEIGYPSTSNSLYSTMTAARAAAEAALSAGSITKARICVQRGFGHGDGRGPSDTNGTCYMADSWGAQATRAEITNGTKWEPYRNFRPNYTSIKLANLEMRSGAVMDIAVQATAVSPTYTMDNVDMYHANEGLGRLVSGGNPTAWCAQVNCIGDGFTGTGGSFNKDVNGWIIQGCRVVALPDQSSDQKGGGGYIFRGRANNIMISRTDMQTRQAWFNNVPGIKTMQRTLRIFGTSQANIAGSHTYVDRCYSEAGQMQVGETSSLPCNFVIERNIVVSSGDNYDAMIALGNVGTIRLNHLVMSPAQPPQNTDGYRVRQGIRVAEVGDNPDVVGLPARVYNNTFVCLANDGGNLELVGFDAVLTSTFEANNILHAPYMPTPVNDHTFDRVNYGDPRYDGYSERRGDTASATPYSTWNTNDDETMHGFTSGNWLRGQTTGFEKQYERTQPRFQSGQELVCNETGGPYFQRLDNTTMQVWQPGEVIEELNGPGGTPTGNTTTLRTAAAYGQPHYSGFDLIGDMPETANPSHELLYSGSGFAPGDIVTGGTTGATALITQVWSNHLWLRNVSIPFVSSEALTSTTGGTGNAASASALSGLGDLWVVQGNPVRESLSWRTHPYSRSDMFGNPSLSKGALHAT